MEPGVLFALLLLAIGILANKVFKGPRPYSCCHIHVHVATHNVEKTL